MADNQKKLSREERESAEERLRLRPPVVYEIVRREGEEEMRRPLASLWWSGIAAGLGITASLLAEGLLHHHLPDTPYRPVLENFGYCAGFLLVIIGRLQLFTENTITVVLPLLAQFSLKRMWIGIRLWIVVFLANMVGTFFTAIVTFYAGTVNAAHMPALLEISHHFADNTPLDALVYGMPAGFFIAAIVWMLPSAEGSKFWIIVAFTYLIALGDFTHVVAGSSEVFLLQLQGDVGIAEGIFGLILPTFVGNIIGGTGLFALLAYGQVHEEI
jgi:formate/nitrite transporter FocA (FNT family)